MSATSPDNDGWNDLYAELGIDSPSPKPESSEPPPEPSDEAETATIEATCEAADGGEYEPEGDSLCAEGTADEGDDDAEDATAEGEEEATPGGGRKRRRRRRRRKKGTAGEEGAAVAPSENALPEAASRKASPRVERQPVAVAESEYDNDHSEVAVATDTLDEENSTEILRDLIAKWNVPSWDQIIASLYRPER